MAICTSSCIFQGGQTGDPCGKGPDMKLVLLYFLAGYTQEAVTANHCTATLDQISEVSLRALLELILNSQVREVD